MTNAEEPPKRATETAGILIADIAGFSKIPSDAFLDAYIQEIFLPALKVLNAFRTLRVTNTWGDAFFGIFGDPVEACRCALELRKLFAGSSVDKGLPTELQIRVAVHVGQIEKWVGAREELLAVMGQDIVLAARIEPVVMPGTILATRQMFTLVEGKASDIAFYDVGVRALPKAFGEVSLYLLAEPNESEWWRELYRAKPNLETDDVSEKAKELERRQRAGVAYAELVARDLDREVRGLVDTLYQGISTEG